MAHDNNTGARPRLEVLISTRGVDGIERVGQMQLPRVEGVCYLVSWQPPHGELPETLLRSDVKIVKTESVGLSNNRNAAFEASTGELLLIADDDLNYAPGGLESVINVMDANPEVDIATFVHAGGDGKQFPDREFDLEKPAKGYYVTSFEIAMRRRVVSGDGGLRFDAEFGIGAQRYTAGEEAIFINDAIKAGFKCRFFPVTIVTHPGVTTAFKPLTAGFMLTQGAVLRECYPWYSALPRIPLIAWRYWRRGRYGLTAGTLHITKGWLAGRKRKQYNKHLN